MRRIDLNPNAARSSAASTTHWLLTRTERPPSTGAATPRTAALMRLRSWPRPRKSWITSIMDRYSDTGRCSIGESVSPASTAKRAVVPPMSPSKVCSRAKFTVTALARAAAPRGRRLGCFDELRIPVERRFRDAPLRRVVHIGDPEPLAVPRTPFEIIEQRPDEIAAHVRTRLDRLEHRGRIGLEKIDARLIRNLAVLADFVGIRSAVFQHIDRQPIALMKRQERVAACHRRHRAADRAVRHSGLLPAEADAERVAIECLHIERRVVVEPEPVDRAADAGEVTGLKMWHHAIGDQWRKGGQQLGDLESGIPVGVEFSCRGGVL